MMMVGGIDSGNRFPIRVLNVVGVVTQSVLPQDQAEPRFPDRCNRVAFDFFDLALQLATDSLAGHRDRLIVMPDHFGVCHE